MGAAAAANWGGPSTLGPVEGLWAQVHRPGPGHLASRLPSLPSCPGALRRCADGSCDGAELPVGDQV